MKIPEKIHMLPIDISIEYEDDGVTFRLDAVAWEERKARRRIARQDLDNPTKYECDTTLTRLSTGSPYDPSFHSPYASVTREKIFSLAVSERVSPEVYDHLVAVKDYRTGTAPEEDELNWYLCVERITPELRSCYAWRIDHIYPEVRWDNEEGFIECEDSDGLRTMLVIVRWMNEATTLNALAHWMMAREQEKKNKLSILENVHKQQTTKEEDNG